MMIICVRIGTRGIRERDEQAHVLPSSKHTLLRGDRSLGKDYINGMKAATAQFAVLKHYSIRQYNRCCGQTRPPCRHCAAARPPLLPSRATSARGGASVRGGLPSTWWSERKPAVEHAADRVHVVESFLTWCTGWTECTRWSHHLVDRVHMARYMYSRVWPPDTHLFWCACARA